MCIRDRPDAGLGDLTELGGQRGNRLHQVGAAASRNIAPRRQDFAAAAFLDLDQRRTEQPRRRDQCAAVHGNAHRLSQVERDPVCRSIFARYRLKLRDVAHFESLVGHHRALLDAGDIGKVGEVDIALGAVSGNPIQGVEPVSYTHLDVYKRQVNAFEDILEAVEHEAAGAPVSYTHLDVYKRQVLPAQL